MKRWLAITLAILTAFAMTFPAWAAPASEDPPPEKMHVVVSAGSYSYGNGAEYTGYIQCTTIEGQNYLIPAEYAGQTWAFDSWDFTCLGEVHYNNYYNYALGGLEQEGKAVIGVAYHTNHSGDPYVAGTIYYDADASTSDLWGGPDTPGPQTIGKGAADGNVSHGGDAITSLGTGTLTVYIYAHDSVKQPCEQQWEDINSVGYGTIDATNETGVPQTLVVNNYYRLIVSGGPWNDSTNDRYDTAIKVDNNDWMALDDWASSDQILCTEGDPLDPTKTKVVFKATDTSWTIRVNDATGEFADNTGGMDYELNGVQPTIPNGCAGQYLLGALIESKTIDAKVATGVAIGGSLMDPIIAGSWIAIITSGGPWKDAGVGADRFDVAMKNLDNTWSELTASLYTACTTHDGNYVTVYVQVPLGGQRNLRVNDTGGFWSNNSGSMGVSVYHVTYSPIPPGGCSQTYQLGDLVDTFTVSGSDVHGEPIVGLDQGPLQVSGGGEVEPPQRYYAIETSGVFYDGNTPMIDAGITMNPPPITSTGWNWSNLQTFADVTCAVPLDPLGHIRVYFTSIPGAIYWLRAQDHGNQYENNSGSLTFSIYKATNLQVPPYTPGTMPGPGICDPYYSHEAVGDISTLLGESETGNALPVLTSNKIYAVETAAGPWLENGTESYEVAISEDNGTTWHNLSNYPSALCAQSADALHILVYFQALAGRSYKLRVYDPNDTYSDNTDSINYIFYDQITTIFCPWCTCSDNYTLTQTTLTSAESTIPSNFGQSGVSVPYIESGKTYAIEISSDSYWNYAIDPSEHHYDAQITADNGSNWSTINPVLNLASCVVQINTATVATEKTYRIYFTAAGNYKLRINSGLSSIVWIALNGHLKYLLYNADSSIPPPPCIPTPGHPCNPPYVPPTWTTACYETYLRPASLFKLVAFQIPSISFGDLGSIVFPSISLPLPAVDDWLAYLGWSIRNYFAWCPMHTAALAAIPTTLNEYEPFGTINELSIALTHINNLLNGLTASGGEGAGKNFTPYSVIFNSGGGEGASSTWQGILPNITTNSPWMGAPLQWNGGKGVHIDTTGSSSSEIADATSNATAYVDYCRSIYDAHLGSGVSFGLCWTIAAARMAPLIWILFQLLADVAAVWGIVKYIQTKVIDLRGSG